MIGAVTVELTGITGPASFARVGDALAALWAAMRVLALDESTHRAYEYFLTRPDAVERATEFLERDGGLTLTFEVAGRVHLLRMHPTAGG
ncbi:hypothetical protein ACIGXM_18690 [Kitasatospora sp. NPDC052896]|uniref:hypothetical protein n=1 Tax=Kitasatospora sp. NPDC052896 TaxID=3364061 RepID=UPI0037C9F9E4